jgi:hypothetical protein
MKDPQALEERERLFDPGRCIFGCSSSISRLDTYPVCYFMDLARSDECSAFCRGSNLWAEKK